MSNGWSQDVEARFFERVRFGLRYAVGGYLLRSLRFESQLDVMADAMVVQLKMELAGRQARTETVDSVRIPLNWWEAVRDRFTPVWVKRRYPVKTRRIPTVLKTYHVCPHVDPDSCLLLTDGRIGHNEQEDGDVRPDGA